jgi:hypothetical protein
VCGGNSRTDSITGLIFLSMPPRSFVADMLKFLLTLRLSPQLVCESLGIC